MHNINGKRKKKGRSVTEKCVGSCRGWAGNFSLAFFTFSAKDVDGRKTEEEEQMTATATAAAATISKSKLSFSSRSGDAEAERRGENIAAKTPSFGEKRKRQKKKT